MKVALITTTINVPTVLALYRKLGPDVRFFVALDKKTPEKAVNYLAHDISNVEIGWLGTQMNWKCSELIGWNTDSRRNIAVLEALKWGAEVIISIDDDMVPLHADFFSHINRIFSEPFSGLQLGSSGHWFDAGQYTNPPARQRGLPAEYDIVCEPTHVHAVTVGALQGSILGVPDSDAMTAIVNRPVINTVTDTLRSGFVVDPHAKAVFNSQITAFRRELAPAFFQFYKAQGRNTDIIASVIMRRTMRDRNLYTYYGPPVGYHARQKRPLLNDLKAELWGIENIDAFQDFMDYTRTDKPIQGSCVPQLRMMYESMPVKLLPPEARACALAWLSDCEQVL